MIIYTDMVGDLCHYGHFKHLEQIYNQLVKDTYNKFYVGVHNDETVKSYKRLPIMTMEERIKMISFYPHIDKLIPNAPLNITKEYIDLHNINIVCIPNNRTDEDIKLMCSTPLELNMIKKFNYTHEISTTDIINRIKNRDDI